VVAILKRRSLMSTCNFSVRSSTFYHFSVIITGRVTAGIAINQQAILRFFAPQGRHESRISVKFGMAEGTAVSSTVPNSTLIREYLGFPVQKKVKNCQNFQLFRPAGANPLFDVDEICTPHQYLEKQPAICYVDDTSLRRNARPVMRWLLANAYVFLVLFHFYSHTYSLNIHHLWHWMACNVLMCH